jgi:ribosomal protein L40E
MEIFGGALGVFLIIFLIILGILWLILPFAIFGIKDKLDTMIRLLKEIKAELRGEEGKEELKSQDSREWVCPNCGEKNPYYKGKCVKCGQTKR